MSKEAEIIKVLKPYFMAFPKSGMDEGALLIYARALSSLSIEEINAAMLKLLRNSKFWPSVAEIFEAAKSVREYARQDALPTAAEAWAEAIDLVRKYGIYKEWEYSCPEVEHVIECFGRYELCMIEENAVNTARAQFMRMYNEIVNRAKDERENEAILEILPKTQAKLAKGKIIELAQAKSVREKKHEN